VLTLAVPTPDYPDFMIPHTGTGIQAIPGHTLVSGSVTKLTSSSDCTILCDLEIWNEATNVWEVFTGSTSGGTVTPGYVTSYTQSSCAWTMSIATADGPTWSPVDEDPDIIYLRTVIWDPDSDKWATEGKLNDPFEITTNFACEADTVEITEANDISTQHYTINPDISIGTNPLVINPSVTHLYTGTTCTMSVDYEYWDINAMDWKEISSSNYNADPFTMDAIGTITVDTLDATSVPGNLRPWHEVKVRVGYTADYAKKWFPGRTVYDTFNITFREDCTDNVLTKNSNIADIEYYIG
jgi:hypothetical protein